MRVEKFKTFRIGLPLAERADGIANMLGVVSLNRVVESCLEEMLQLIETAPGNRVVPKLVCLVDAARKHGQSPPALPEPTGPQKPPTGGDCGDEDMGPVLEVGKQLLEAGVASVKRRHLRKRKS